MTYTIEVTQEDIEKGFQRQPFECAVALACYRAIGDQVEVAPTFITCGQLPNGWHVSTTPEVKKFIEDFDIHKGFVQPFSFSIDIPEEGK